MPDKMKFETPNLTAENAAKIAELFPAAVAEGKVNFDLLRTLLGEEVFGDEAYEFTWVGKRAAIAEASRPIRKTLRPVRDDEAAAIKDGEKTIEYTRTGSRDWDTTENLYIEGDNLDALKLLQESYLGKVKMIYIDPPYNTGNDLLYINDFGQSIEDYEAEFVIDENGYRMFKNTESNGRFHSDWLSMMYPRLRLASNLLADAGVIVVAIDDNELSNLNKMLDEIFGEENKLGIVTVVHKQEGRNQEKFFGTSTEYALFYAKNKNITKFNSIAIDEEILEKFDKKDDNGRYRLKNFIRLADGKYATRQAKPNFWYPIYVSNDLKDISLEKKDEYFEVFPIIDNGAERTWKTLPTTFQELYENGSIIAMKNNDKIVIYEKLRENQVVKTHWIKKEYHAYHYGTKKLEELLEISKVFDFPKSLDLIVDTLKLTTDKSALILDFFSGSATTAHAVMQLNAEDGGKRKFIMVQLPEVCGKDTEAAKAGYAAICEIGKERIRRAGDKIKAEIEAANAQPKLTEEPKQIPDIGFRVLKLDDTNMNDVYYAAGEYTQNLVAKMQSNIKPDRTDMDLLFGCLLDWGLPLSMPHVYEKIDGFTVHTYNGGDLIACFEEHISEKAVREIASRKPLRAVFRDFSFVSSQDKINVFEIFKLSAPNTTVKVL
ncbi:MAG: site-specific DNA-methyltransferase [Campylobacteraceae bacterium]|jgi:adenine-specific DNA-methyltransferase|nr:site-specific DNA-methyltransferase [Campylobacteraceae bacterium]